MTSEEDSTNSGLSESFTDTWYLKQITFEGRPVKIITQNFNGPCSFIAICNILILRGDLELPQDRTTVSYEILSQLLAEYLLAHCPDVDISSALSIMPYTCKGMDLNPVFTDTTQFRPAGPSGSSGLELFSHARISLVHGWLVDPESQEYDTLKRSGDYDNSVNLIVEMDHLTQGRLVVDTDANEAGPSASTSRQNESLPPELKTRVEDAVAIRTFLDNTQSQLTYYGLFHLASTLPSNSLSALFRGSHLSVLYKTPPDHSEEALYSLVTDQSFLHEPSVVWEKFEDIDGGASTFVDSEFIRSSPAGGDYAGHTGESALAEIEAQAAQLSISNPVDEELARQLQAEEDDHAHEIYMRQQQAKLQQTEREQEERAAAAQQEVEHRQKKKRDCIIM